MSKRSIKGDGYALSKFPLTIIEWCTKSGFGCKTDAKWTEYARVETGRASAVLKKLNRADNIFEYRFEE